MEVAEILDRAEVSREDFYEHFESKHDCMAAVQKEAADRLRAKMLAAWDAVDVWPLQVREGVRVGLEFARETPELALVLLPTSLVSEPRLARTVWAMSDFLAGAVRNGSDGYPGAHRPPAVTEQVLVGGVQALIMSRIRAGQVESLPALETEMTQTILMPYIGLEEAEKFVRDGRPNT